MILAGGGLVVEGLKMGCPKINRVFLNVQESRNTLVYHQVEV